MKNNLLKIAFSIPTYKRESELIRLISSIYCSFRLLNKNISLSIFVRDNDCNSNLSEEKLSSYCPNIDLIYSKNQFNEGARANVWRTLVKASKGADYVCLVSDDDYILPDYLERIVSLLIKKPIEYLITNYYMQYSNLKASPKQYGLEKEVLKKFINSPKENIIISNRILTGTCFSQTVINRMVNLCDKSYYESQWYVQFLGCFANSFYRSEEKLSVHQVLNKTYWEPFDNNKYDDMVISRIKGYKFAYGLIKADKKDLSNLLLKTIINYPIWYALRIIFDKGNQLNFSKFKFFIYKPFHLKIVRDLKLSYNSLRKYLRKLN